MTALYTGKYPQSRLRRMRSHDFSRRLIQETTLQVSDLIYPMFVTTGINVREPIAAMPGIFRYSIDNLIVEAQECVNLGIPAIALFPVIPPEQKSPMGEEAYNPEGLMQQAIRALKQAFPELGISTEVALDAYTTHGQDGVLNAQQEVDNDRSITLLSKQALSHAVAGADIVAPSDMMDGRVQAIRNSLEDQGFHHTKILSYAIKYHSNFYHPYREAIGSIHNLGKNNKKSYQLDPCNTDEALREVAQDIQEGADLIMIKPAMCYLDIIARTRAAFNIPIIAYQISGEYSMLMAAIERGWLPEQEAILESLIAIKRAGARAIFSYFAPRVARWLTT